MGKLAAGRTNASGVAIEASGKRRRSGEEQELGELVPVPLRFYALFVVPLVLLMLWAVLTKR